MLRKTRSYLFVLVLAAVAISCQKEIELEPPPQPKLGTKWIYRYTTYGPSGGIVTSFPITYRAVNFETLGNEQWINVVDSVGATVWYLSKKPDGLYQYADSKSNLFFKYPAKVNDTYTTYNDGGDEDFTVKAIKDSIDLPFARVEVNYYEGVKAAEIRDKIWYNTDLWIIRRDFYRRAAIPGGLYYRRYSMILQEVIF